MKKNMQFIIQQGLGGLSLKEKFACEKYPYIKTTYDHLTCTVRTATDIRKYCPVGSVEFVQLFCELNNIKLPENMTYPIELRPYLGREIRQNVFGRVLESNFVKPIHTKVFTGGIKSQLTETVSEDCLVWESDSVVFDAEFRCYVIDKKMVAYSRYDDSDAEYVFDVSVVEAMISEWTDQPIAYAIDVGIVNGKTVLVEVNDGWSLGYYKWGTMTDKLYAELIYRRWNEIVMESEPEEEYDVVIETLQDRIDTLWKMCERNEQWGIMDHIRLEQIEELKNAQKMWKENKQ